MAKLEQLSPLRILDRGYAIVQSNTGLVKSPVDAPPNTEVRIRFATGSIAATTHE